MTELGHIFERFIINLLELRPVFWTRDINTQDTHVVPLEL